MQNNLWTKGLAFVIILLFVGTSVLPSISGDLEIGKNSVLNQINATSSVSSTLTDWWPMSRHDTGNTGYSLSEAPTNWVEYWKYHTERWYNTGSPAVVNGKVYVGNPSNMSVLCIDATDGSLIWAHSCGEVFSSPAVESGKVYVSYMSPYGNVGGIVCLNAETGNQLWEKTIQYFFTSPIITAGKVYIASSGVDFPTGTLTCYNATTGSQVWTYTTSLWDYIMSLAILNGKLYCLRDRLADVHEIYVSCLNPTTGRLTWDKKISSDGYAFPFSIAAAGNTVVVASAHFEGDYGRVYGLDATTGATRWDYETGEWYISSSSPGFSWPSLAIAYDRVYFIAGRENQNSVVYCLDLSTGNEIWTQNAQDFSEASPAIADEKLYFSTLHGFLICLNAADGEFIKSTFFKGCSSSPSIANKTIFIVDIDGWIFAYGAQREPAVPTIQGPADGKIKTLYNYTFSTIDAQGDSLYYFIDWGDEQSEDWVGPYASGEQVVIGHSWSEKETYTIKAKAKDVYGFEGDWGTLTVTMPCSYNTPFMQFWIKLLERFPNAFPILRQLLGY